jgi:hypothetical protein
MSSRSQVPTCDTIVMCLNDPSSEQCSSKFTTEGHANTTDASLASNIEADGPGEERLRGPFGGGSAALADRERLRISMAHVVCLISFGGMGNVKVQGCTKRHSHRKSPVSLRSVIVMQSTCQSTCQLSESRPRTHVSLFKEERQNQKQHHEVAKMSRLQERAEWKVEAAAGAAAVAKFDDDGAKGAISFFIFHRHVLFHRQSPCTSKEQIPLVYSRHLNNLRSRRNANTFCVPSQDPR